MLRNRSLARCFRSNKTKDYLKRLAHIKNLIVVVAVQDQVQGAYDEEMDKLWKELGFQTNLCGQYWRGYAGVVEDKSVIFEKLGDVDGAVHYRGSPEGIQMDVKSCPFWDKNVAEICVNGVDFSARGRGINLVVYDKKAGRVVDSVCIDTHVEALTLTRKDLRTCSNEPLVSADMPAPVLELDPKQSEYREKILPAKMFPGAFKGNPVIKVRLMYDYGLFMWNSVESLLKAYASDERFDVCVVFWEDYFSFPEGQKLANEIGINSVCIRDYHLEEDSPEIVLTMVMATVSVYRRTYYEEWQKHSKLFVALSGMLMMNLSPTDFAAMPAQVAPRLRKFGLDYCFWDSLIYNKLKSDGFDMLGCVEMGNPKFDAIYEQLNQIHDTLPEGWKKLRGKTTFLWAGTHEYWIEECTFDEYAKTLFDYFAEHHETGLIFRPHPQLINELKKDGLWTENEIKRIKVFFQTTPNIVWDENTDYSLSYQMADAIITDAGCGVTVSGLATLKPICACFSTKSPKYFCFPELFDGLYQVQSEQEMLDFFELIQRGEDPLKERREQAFQKCVCHFDGKNGQRMKDFITEKYFEKYGTEY